VSSGSDIGGEVGDPVRRRQGHERRRFLPSAPKAAGRRARVLRPRSTGDYEACMAGGLRAQADPFPRSSVRSSATVCSYNCISKVVIT
jgi:hypothetical protein